MVDKIKLEAATGRTWNTVWAPVTTDSAQEGNLVLSRLPILSSSIKQFDTAFRSDVVFSSPILIPW